MAFRLILASVYDLFIAAALGLTFTALCMLSTNNQAIPPGTRWYQFGLLLLLFLYYFFSLKFGGQTIGMRAWRIKVLLGWTKTTIVRV